jgi:uncharacterized membrane protein
MKKLSQVSKRIAAVLSIAAAIVTIALIEILSESRQLIPIFLGLLALVIIAGVGVYFMNIATGKDQTGISDEREVFLESKASNLAWRIMDVGMGTWVIFGFIANVLIKQGSNSLYFSLTHDQPAYIVFYLSFPFIFYLFASIARVIWLYKNNSTERI